MKANNCANVSCCGAPTLIFPCSGASDVGEICDRAARRLAKQGLGRMYCLAGVGGRVPEILENARRAETILAIDGCEKDCAANTLRKADIKKFTHLRLADIGMEKGQTPANGANIGRVIKSAAGLLSQ